MQTSGQGPGWRERNVNIHRIHWNQKNQKRKGQRKGFTGTEKRGKMKEGPNAVTETDSAMFDLPTDKELTAK